MMDTKKCVQCGQEKPVEDFSKSYRNLCKACVAENVRAKRRNLFGEGFVSTRTILHEEPTQFIPHPRLTIATAALQGLLASGKDGSNSILHIVTRAIAYADTMMNELKKYKDENDN